MSMKTSPPWARALLLFAAGALLLVFWDNPLLWPVKILVVLFHELSHALAAVLTGGEVESIGLSIDQGGHTQTRGGFRFLILNAGYLGSLLWGVALLAAARRPNTVRAVAFALAFVLLVTSVLYIRPVVGFGFLFSLLAAAGVAALARYAPAHVTAGGMKGLGVFSVLYALLDIRDDVFRAGSAALSDATMLSQATGVPSLVWGVAWLGAGGGVLWLVRRWIV
jgi:hypothetical protein